LKASKKSKHDPKKPGHDRTIVFFNDSPSFAYEKPDALVDVRSGVICSPNNFDYDVWPDTQLCCPEYRSGQQSCWHDEPLGEGMIRITALANHDRWASLDESRYRIEKLRWYDRTLASAVRFVPDFRNHVIDTDMFTPLTIRRFTGHENGAVYGAPDKKYDGRTHLDNLYVCGTDQGMVGIIGSIVSGITIANKYLLGGA